MIPQFKHKKDLFDYLVKNKAELIEIRKSSRKEFVSGLPSYIPSINKGKVEVEETDVINRSIIGNTYYWMDSHKDVHVKGVFTKTIKENKAKIRFTHDHEQTLMAKIGRFTDIVEKEVAWSELGINKLGNTICLIGEAQIEKAENEKIFKGYLNNEIDQHSVEMFYNKIELAINDKDYKEEYKSWTSVFPLLGNPVTANKEGYFYVVSDAKLRAISCVVEASNELTGIYEPSAEPNITRHKDTPIDFAKLAKVKYL